VLALWSFTLPSLGACEKVCSAMAALRISVVNGSVLPLAPTCSVLPPGPIMLTLHRDRRSGRAVADDGTYRDESADRDGVNAIVGATHAARRAPPSTILCIMSLVSEIKQAPSHTKGKTEFAFPVFASRDYKRA